MERLAAPRYTPRMIRSDPPQVRVRLPEAPALVAGAGGAAWVSPAGEVETLPLDRAAARLAVSPPPLVCHARATAVRLGTSRFDAHDLLELFAFVRPARFCVPTPRGLAEALGLPLPATPEQAAASLFSAATELLGELARLNSAARQSARTVAWAMARGGWLWGGAVLAALGLEEDTPPRSLAAGLRVWMRLPEWKEHTAEPPAGDWPVEAVEARARLMRLLGTTAEDRPQQTDYASHVAAAFAPRERADEPAFVIAEAGTGVGKTVGYIAPASVWVEKNSAPVWISTYTRNLQRQLDAELDRLYPDPERKAAKIVIRKGRENYFCLLNLDEAVSRLPERGGADAVPLGLMARWALATRDGDMVGGDFPAWLADLVGTRLTVDLTDTRGECVYAACPHYRKCFVERSIRRARGADMVVANHALVMTQAALGGGEDGLLPTRYVFDEGHHLFDAADSAFSAHLSGMETADLRRWLLGAESRGRSRSRGLRERIGDLLTGEGEAMEALEGILHAARALPGPGWRQRIGGGNPVGAAEAFLALARQQVLARESDPNSPYGLEAHARPPVPGMLEAAASLDKALGRLDHALTALLAHLSRLLDDQADELETAARARIESARRSLERRAVLPVRSWRAMLAALREDTPPEFADWLAIDREYGRERDVGLHRHWLDPMQPFATVVAEPAHGLLVTSASLRDGTGDEDADWRAADIRTGIRHVRVRDARISVPSPFDYKRLTRVFVVTDVDRRDIGQVSAAYRALFLAAGGGGLGLFTAILRLRDVHSRISAELESAGLQLLAQHVDGMDTSTLIDIFRAEEHSCLLGTDAVRDGIDVPGNSLRMIVFDRVPWPRPTILHRARKEVLGGRAFDEMLARLRLKQAYGRLVRRADDRGVFVMLDRALPSRLTSAFPTDVAVERVGLARAVAETRAFLGERGD